MSFIRTPVRKYGYALLAVLSLATSSLAETNLNARLATIRIKNFGRINDNYYRGAQPETRDYRDLAALGVKTVVDLTRDGRSDERLLVERAGMKFYRIPLTTSDRPAQSAVTQFLNLVNDPAHQPIYVHCQGGRHRTGVMTAVYRMTEDGWTADRAYEEMKRYKFEGFPGHPALKKFVYDYYAQLGRSRAAETPRTPEALTPAASGAVTLSKGRSPRL
jgi:protein tyrosine/serine phosphatase